MRLIRDREKGGGGMEVGEEGDFIYLLLHCPHHNDSCIMMGSDESHFNSSIGTEVLPLTSLTPYRKAKPAHNRLNRDRTLLLPRADVPRVNVGDYVASAVLSVPEPFGGR